MKAKKDPQWVGEGVRDVQFRLAWAFVLMLVLSVAVEYGLEAIGAAAATPRFILLIPAVFLFVGGTAYAYRRGVRDSQSHPLETDSRPDQSKAN